MDEECWNVWRFFLLLDKMEMKLKRIVSNIEVSRADFRFFGFRSNDDGSKFTHFKQFRAIQNCSWTILLNFESPFLDFE